ARRVDRSATSWCAAPGREPVRRAAVCNVGVGDFIGDEGKGVVTANEGVAVDIVIPTF
ncbi:MAG: hypothetical protein K0S78_3538, partial [Thermomicrobiales bacterium]|nr:hypothetical protein [Thermomicrobiales bacterium]